MDTLRTIDTENKIAQVIRLYRTITLSAYNSTLKIPGTNYTEFLTYLWNFTQFTSSAPNATNQFSFQVKLDC